MPYVCRMADRDRKLTVLLTLEEMSKLEQLAEDQGVTASQEVRALIKTAHVARYGHGAKPRPTMPNLRGIIKDLTGRAHYTVGNIAMRAQLPLETILVGLKTLERRKLARYVGDSGPDATWEAIPPTYDEMIAAAKAKGLDLDGAIGGE